jgi:excisionase family DNA binding protein
MSNNTISKPITTWTELWASDREVLSRAEVARLLGVDSRTISAAVESGALPGMYLGRRLLIPRRPLLEKLGISEPPPRREQVDDAAHELDVIKAHGGTPYPDLEDLVAGLPARTEAETE